MGACALAELADQLAGGVEHDRIQAAAAVGLPCREDVFGERGEVADMDSSTPPIWSRSCAAAAADGASPITAPPASVQAAARVYIAAVVRPLGPAPDPGPPPARDRAALLPEKMSHRWRRPIMAGAS